MTTPVFPLPHHLGRPNRMVQTIQNGNSTISLISGNAGSGVTTTLATIGNSCNVNGKHVVHLRIDEDEALPDIDSISMPEYNEDIVKYITEEYRPDMLIIDNATNNIAVNIACRAAQNGTSVMLGMNARSDSHAINRFMDLADDRGGLTPLVKSSKNMISLSVHQKFVAPKQDKASIQSRMLCQYSLRFVREMMYEVNPDRFYASAPKDNDLAFDIFIP